MPCVHVCKGMTHDQRLGALSQIRFVTNIVCSHTESGWTDNDRGEEQWLMEELVSIIEQKNQIINNLDLDMQRYSE